MGIKTVPHRPYSQNVAPCDFWLFPKLTGCRYESIEEMKEALKKVNDTLTQEDFHGALKKLLERYNKCIAAREDCFERYLSLMCVLSIKVPIRKSLETYLMIVVYHGFSYYCFKYSVFYVGHVEFGNGNTQGNPIEIPSVCIYMLLKGS